MEEMEWDVYKGVFDTVRLNMENAGESFPYYEETFFCDVCSDPGTIDVSKYTSLENKKFFQALFVAVLKRLPDEKEEAGWKSKYGMDQETFQTESLKMFVNSSVSAINHMVFVNNPYFNQKRGVRYHVLGMLYGLTDKSALRVWGKKMPRFVQKIIRKVFI